MASNLPGNCCARGLIHEGTAQGHEETFNGINTYVSGDAASPRALVIFADVWGHESINVRLLADSFAAKGFYVLIPDEFDGGAAPKNPPEGWNLMTDWLPLHQPPAVVPRVEKFWKHVETLNKTVFATGYCFGAKYALKVLAESRVVGAAVAHPSFVTLDEVKAIKGPLFISACEIDPIYTEELRHKTEAALKEVGATYHTTLASGVSHGFSVRGDLTDPKVKYAKEKVFSDWLEWFKFVESLQSSPKI